MNHANSIEKIGTLFALHTADTSYVFRVGASGHLEHLHYGAALHCTKNTERALAQKPAFHPGASIMYAPEHSALCLDQLRGEIATTGKGDLGAPFIAVAFADGNRTTDFVFSEAEILTEKPALSGLPSAYGADAALRVTLADADCPALTLQLVYGVFVKTNVITRSAVLINGTDAPISIEKFASTQLDFNDSDFVFTSFHGAWADEMNRCDTPLCGNTVLCESRGGTSGNHANPFTMLARAGASETAGDVYGCNLIYSGNHQTRAEVGAFGRLRLQTGISPEGFCCTLAAGAQFTVPEAVHSYSAAGYGGLSRQLHAFTRAHIVRGTWQHKERPVLLNSWEACYMRFNEAKLLKLAKAGKACGVELFVLDDGWFGTRDDDKQALGDWTVNLQKLPDGLHGLADKINALGLSFGIWVEPEMVNVNSDLYRAHPDWTLEAPNRTHSEGRNQRILDLCNPEVRTYVKESVAQVLRSANISYVKWDMNRVMSDVFSPYLVAMPIVATAVSAGDTVEFSGQGTAAQTEQARTFATMAQLQSETAHRYILGLYEVLQALVEEFPEVLFESCASGGNRADLGMLCYMPQVWASDNTDAICRARIQTNYSYAYPLSVLGCHVSACPNHQTLRNTPLDTRFNVALCGLLGYELDFTQLSGAEKKEITAQIAFYKMVRPWLQMATYYRVENGDAEVGARGAVGTMPMAKFHGAKLPRYRWCAVSQDKENAVAVDVQLLQSLQNAPEQVVIRGLLPMEEYRVRNFVKSVDMMAYGSAINAVSPIAMKPGGLLHHIAAKVVPLPGETEDCVISGSALGTCGAALCPPFNGTGLNEFVKHYPDFASRLYLATHCEEAQEREEHLTIIQ